jgi:hypothetical protein
VSLHKFFSCLKQFGYPSLAADYTLALSSLMAAVVKLHEKRPALPEKLKELQTKGRKINSNAQISKDYASKKNESSRGQTAQYRAVPKFPPLRLH